MEALEIVVQLLVSIFWAPVVEIWKYHRRVISDIEELKDKLDELKCRKDDMETTVRGELLRGKTIKREYEHWRENVDKISSEVEELNGEVGKVRYFDRVRLGKRIVKKLKEVRELYEKGNSFSSLVVDTPMTEVVTEEILAKPVLNEEIVPCSPDEHAEKAMASGMRSAVMDYVLEAMQQRGKKRYTFGVLVGGLMMQGGCKMVEKYKQKNKKAGVYCHKNKKAKKVH